MLTRVFDTAGLLASLAETKVQLGFCAVRRTAVATQLQLAASVLTLAASIGLAGALYIMLVPRFGAPGALAAVSGLGLVLAGAVWSIARQTARGGVSGWKEQALRRSIEKQREDLSIAIGTAEPKVDDASPQSVPPSPSSAATMLSDPKVLVAAAVAVVGLIGPWRALRAMQLASALAATTAFARRSTDGQNRE